MSNCKILVFGYNGQVATALRELLSEKAVFFSSQEANFTDTKAVIQKLDSLQPEIVVNASAYTQVDKAEDERDLCLTINAQTPGLIAEWCLRNKATLIHYSTDYVFNGEGDKPWLESDTTQPINWYGHSKLEGEKNIINSKCSHYILRISWVHSPWGSNFPKTIIRLASEREELKIVDDQWGAPTDARDVAKVTVQLCEQISANTPPPQGIYHLRFSEYMTWFTFAKNIIEDAKKMGLDLKLKKLLPITSSEFPTKAKRPINSRLGTLRHENFCKVNRH